MKWSKGRHVNLSYLNRWKIPQQELRFPDVVYKSVWKNNKLTGFLILALDPDGQSVEFHRIVISRPGEGYGKQVVRIRYDTIKNFLN
jgi:hypothetical protein